MLKHFRDTTQAPAPTNLFVARGNDKGKWAMDFEGFTTTSCRRALTKTWTTYSFSSGYSNYNKYAVLSRDHETQGPHDNGVNLEIIMNNSKGFGDHGERV